MSDDPSNKVIDIFRRHRHGDHVESEECGEMVISPDGFNYVSVKQEHNNGNMGEASQLEIAASRHYLIKMMEVHHETEQIRINNYYIPGDRLTEFMLSLPQRPGQLLEIKQLLPDQMA